jgi:hypothetical protein
VNVRELAFHISAKRSFLVYHDPADCSFIPAERGADLQYDATAGWMSEMRSEKYKRNEAIRAARYADQLNDLYVAGLRLPVFMDMKDAILESNDEFPSFQYVRRRAAANSILWPLKRVHEIGRSEFCAPLDPEESGFRDKEPVVFWRGIVRGFSTFGGKRTNIKSVLQKYLENKVSRDLLMAHLETVPRYVFVSRYFDKPGFDVGFSQAKRLQTFKKIDEIERYRKEHATHAEHRNYRYQISIEGTDVGTSFAWHISTNCILFKQSYPWEVFFEGHFQAGEDYLLARSDFADVEEKVAWCEDNLDSCEDMIERRHRVVPFLVDREISKQAMRSVVQKYEAFYRSCGAT